MMISVNSLLTWGLWDSSNKIKDNSAYYSNGTICPLTFDAGWWRCLAFVRKMIWEPAGEVFLGSLYIVEHTF